MVAERLAAEREFWASVKESEEPGELQAYLDRYPGGAYAVLARGRLKRLQDAAAQRVEPEAVAEVAASAPSAPASSPPAASVAAPAVLFAGGCGIVAGDGARSAADGTGGAVVVGV